MSSRPPAQLIVDSACLMQLGGDDMKSSEFGHFRAQDDICSSSCHIGCDGDASRLPGFGNDHGLDEVLPGQAEAMVHESIVDPNADIATGYPPNVMPANFEQKLSPKEIEDLVKYLLESTSGGGKGSSKKSG